MLSCAQCTNSVRCEKAIVENLNQFFFAAEQFFEMVFWMTGKDRWKQRHREQDMQMEDGGL